MAVPSRVFVGMVVFGLIASLAIVPFTLLILSGYESTSASPLIPDPGEFTPGEQLVWVLASLFSITLTVIAWRNLLAGARRDAATRKARAENALAQKNRGDPPAAVDEQPPGYN